MTEITVLIVDDHEIVRQGIRAFLATQPDIAVVGEAADGSAAVDAATVHAPDVVLMDLVMPVMDGVEATRRIKAVSPRSQVIVLTSYHDDEHVFPAVRAGALSYVLKDLHPSELADAIRRAAAGDAVLHPHVAARLVQEVHGRRGARPNPFTDLTDREMEVLRLVAEGVNNAGIAAKLFISEKTVKSHVSNILGKLHLADRTQAAAMAWREGVLKRGEAPRPDHDREGGGS